MPLPAALEGKLRLPLIGAPMYIVSNPDLVIAQCTAGIVGSFPALNARPQETLDDVTANILYQQGRKAHTARCEIRYRQPARVGETLKLKGWIENERRRLVILKGEIRRASDDVVVADCESSFMLEKA